MRNINRMNDYFVRYLLGSLGSEDILEDIVNAVLEDLGFEIVIKNSSDVIYKNDSEDFLFPHLFL